MDWIVPTVIVAGLVALCVGVHRLGMLCLRRRFARRPAMDEAVWFQAFLPDALDIADDLKDVLRSLGGALGVEHTRLRPNDRFTVELRSPWFCRALWWPGDLTQFEEVILPDWLTRHRIKLPSMFVLPDRVDELLRLLAAKCREAGERA